MGSLDLILSRYGSAEYYLNLPYKDGIALLRKAYEKEQDEKIWQMWLAQLPYMNKENYVSFSDYRAKLLNQSAPHKEQSVDDQIAMCKLLNAAFGGEVVEL